VGRVEALLPKVKENLMLRHGEDDGLLGRAVLAALSYAEAFQKKPRGAYTADAPPGADGGGPGEMTPATEQAVVMMASHLYESRDGSTGGFFADSPAAAGQSMAAVDRLLMHDKEWVV